MAPTVSGEAVATKPNKMATPSEILKELRSFVSGTTGFGAKYGSTELARSALFLLRTLPAARDAVLEHLCTIFDEAVNNHLRSLDPTEARSSSAGGGQVLQNDHGVIQNVQEVLSNFISGNPEAWAPIVSGWSLDLLGQLSSKYAERRGVPHASGLNEVLQLWMTCRPTRILVNLTTQCISTLISGNPDRCIDALLDTSVQHSPHFDWVVAHIGSCFPTTIITRVLACGLKDFCSHSSKSGMTEQQTFAEKKVPKVASVVGILGHLVGQHSEDIRNALLSLFQESFEDQPTMQQLATVPFLLELASMSSMNVVTTEFIKALTPQILNKLCHQIPMWRQHSTQTVDELVNLVVHLVLQSHEGGEQVISFLLETSTPVDGQQDVLSPQVLQACGQILDYLLLEIQRLVNARHNCGQAEIPLLGALQHFVPTLCQHLLSNSERKVQWTTRLLAYLSMQCGQSVATQIACFILTNSSKPFPILKVLPELLSVVEPCVSSLLNVTIALVLTENKAKIDKSSPLYVKNLLHLVQWEDRMQALPGQEIPTQRHFTNACIQNLSLLVDQLVHPNVEIVSGVVELLATIPFPEALPMSQMARLCRCIVQYFFTCVSFKDWMSRINYSLKCENVVRKLCLHPSGQQAILRGLMEGVLLSPVTYLFGGSYTTDVNSSARLSQECDTSGVSLLQENQKHAVKVTLPQSHSSVFHAGVIGRPLVRLPDRKLVKEDYKNNIQLLLDALKWACFPNSGGVAGPSHQAFPTNGITALSLLLVELVSPDVMFNGLPWPDEDFTKVTVERDLHIKRMFELNPVLWHLLAFVATTRPALCYCSVLLRALTAVVMSYWSSCQWRMATDSPKQLEMTCGILEIMSLGSLLPPPLSLMAEIFPSLTPFEVYILMCDVWRYMKENVPTPAAYMTVNVKGQMWRDFKGSCEKKFTARLHCVLQNNIHKFGHLYTRFFQNDEADVIEIS